MIGFILSYVSPLFVLFPLIVGFRNYRNYANSEKIIVWFLITSAIASIICVSLAKNGTNNMPAFHVGTVLEFLLFCFFYRELSLRKDQKLIYLIIAIAFVLLEIISLIFWQPIKTYNSITRTTESLLLISFAVSNLFQNLGVRRAGASNHSPLIWINSGVILYFSGALFLFVFSDFLAKGDHDYYMIAWLIHAILVAAFLYCAIGIYLIKTKRK